MTCDEQCIRNIIKEELMQFQNSQPKDDNGSSKSRKGNKKKSNWNIFLADCTKRQPNGTPLGDRTKACSVEYKELKNKGSLEDYLAKLPKPSDKIVPNGTTKENEEQNGNTV